MLDQATLTARMLEASVAGANGHIDYAIHGVITVGTKPVTTGVSLGAVRFRAEIEAFSEAVAPAIGRKRSKTRPGR